MAPIVPPKYLSVTGAHDWPALIDLKTPPPGEPIQNSFGREGFPTPATERPPRYGPISRQRRPANAMESRSLYDPLNKNPILNPPGQHVTPGLQTPSQAVKNLPAGPTVETATRTAVAGYSVPEVRQVQTALRRLGYYRGDVDGDFGENTQNALESYQTSTGEPVTGTLNQGVLSRLGVTTR